MSTTLERHGYGTLWTDIHTDSYESYYPNMTDYHMHDYYEISLILSGNVHVLLSDMGESSTQSKIVLLRPHTPHYIYCQPDMLYSRRNISFSADFIIDLDPHWQQLVQSFGKNGSVYKLTDSQKERYLELFNRISTETDLFRKKLLLFYLLSLITDGISEASEFSPIPGFVTESLAYLSSHCSEKVVIRDLSDRLQIGRTTLLTAFKRYTGVTVNEYLTRCRLKNAVAMLRNGCLQQQVAEECGFGNACGLIRSFRRIYGMTPKQYLLSTK